MKHEALLGVLFWAIVFYPFWSPRCRRIRRAAKAPVISPGARSSTRQTGPAWVQDEPYPECFEEDDLDG